jgi:hypothetical protein
LSKRKFQVESIDNATALYVARDVYLVESICESVNSIFIFYVLTSFVWHLEGVISVVFLHLAPAKLTVSMM